jgi:hypothetical protein
MRTRRETGFIRTLKAVVTVVPYSVHGRYGAGTDGLRRYSMELLEHE